jgi:hypothetical protein
MLSWLLLAAQAQETEPLRFMATGGLDGIRAGDVRFDVHQRLPDGTVTAIAPTHGWMSHGPWFVGAESHRVADTLTGLRTFDSDACEPVPDARIHDTGPEILVTDGTFPAPIVALLGEGDLRPAWRCPAGDSTLQLIGPPDAIAPIPPTSAYTDWEFRRSLRMALDQAVVHTIAIPPQEGTRLYRELRSLRAVDDLLYVDAGDFVDGFSSVRDNGLSLHRPTSFAVLDGLSPHAVAPGRNELAAGIVHLLGEAPDLPWVASNWQSKDPARALPDHRIVDVGGRRVAIVAALDPALVRELPVLAAEGITLLDPVSSVQAVIDGLPEVDVTVLLTSAHRPLVDTLHRRLRGVDVILGDTTTSLGNIVGQEWALADVEGAAAVLPIRGPVVGELTTAGDGLQGIALSPIAVSGRTRPDPAIRAAVTTVRADTYPTLDRPLLPAPPDDPTAILPARQWEKVVCETVLEQTGADIAVLPALPSDRTSPGAVTALVVSDWLATGDRLEIHHVPGSTFRRLLDQLAGSVDVSCGADIGARFPRARGRLLEDERLYEVVTTDTLRASGLVGTLLQGARSIRTLDRPGFGLFEDDEGPVSLRRAVVDGLTALRADTPDTVIPRLLKRSSSDRDPQWLLRVRQASLTVEGFRGSDDPAYADVPETLVTSPSSFTVGSALDVAIDYSSARIAWDARARSLFTQLSTEEQSVESADDVLLSTSLALPGVVTPPVGGVSFGPYAEALVDTEWTEVEEASQRQADGSVTLGLAARRVGILRTFRVGLLVNQDLALTEKNAELGGRLEVQTRAPLGPGMAWINQIDGFVYGDTVDQDASDLRFKTQLESRLDLPLSRWLSLGAFGRLFVFQGRVEATRQVRFSAAAGASVAISGAFDL